MRKMTIWLVTIVMLVSMFAPITASATFEQNESDLMIYSQECPQAAISYATQSYMNHVNSMVSLKLLRISGKVSLGSPFTIMGEYSNTPVFYFPVINNKKIIATYRVYVDESRTNNISTPIYAGILSEYMVPELVRLSTLTSEESVALLYMDNQNVMLQLNGRTELLLASPQGLSPTNSSVSVRSDYEVANVLEEISENAISLDQARSSTAMSLALNICEQQQGNSWCSAYATSAIIRYKTNSSTPLAQQIMAHFYGSGLDADDRLSESQAILAGNIYNLYPVQASGRISNASVISQIQSYSPVYFVGNGIVNGKFEDHAMVICGYNVTNNTFIIWNPWNPYLETMNMSTYQYTGQGVTFTWVRTIYDW